MGLIQGVKLEIMAKTKTAAKNNSAWDQVEIGDQVKHAKWGVGTVLFRTGMGKTAKAIIAFPEEGQKKMMLKYSKLVKVGSTSLKSVEKIKAETDPEVKKKIRKAAPAKVAIPDIPVANEEEAEVEIELGKVPGGIVLGEDDESAAGFEDDEEEAEFSGGEKGDSE
jgi:hypothetical protein